MYITIIIKQKRGRGMIKDQLTKNNVVGPNTREIEKLREVFPHYFDKNGNFMIDRLKELLGGADVFLDLF